MSICDQLEQRYPLQFALNQFILRDPAIISNIRTKITELYFYNNKKNVDDWWDVPSAGLLGIGSTKVVYTLGTVNYPDIQNPTYLALKLSNHTSAWLIGENGNDELDEYFGGMTWAMLNPGLPKVNNCQLPSYSALVTWHHGSAVYAGIITEDITCDNKYSISEKKDSCFATRSDGTRFLIDPRSKTGLNSKEVITWYLNNSVQLKEFPGL